MLEIGENVVVIATGEKGIIHDIRTNPETTIYIVKIENELRKYKVDYQITYENDGNKFVSTDRAAPLTLYFADGRLYYEVEITEDFKVIYNYELSK